MRAFAVAVAVAAFAAAGAHARPHEDARIIPGVGIGKVRLGMTEAQVRKALGAPLGRRIRKGTFGRSEVVLQYGFTAYTVVLRGPRAATRRVTEVATGLASERTARGEGFGTPEKTLVARYGARLRCERLATEVTREGRVIVDMFPDAYRDCVLAGAGAETVFRTSVRKAWNGLPEEWRDVAEVFEVVVRTT